MSFLNSLENKSKKFEDPFLHWELDKPLTDEQINEIVKADIANPIEHDLNYDGSVDVLDIVIMINIVLEL